MIRGQVTKAITAISAEQSAIVLLSSPSLYPAVGRPLGTAVSFLRFMSVLRRRSLCLQVQSGPVGDFVNLPPGWSSSFRVAVHYGV